MLTTKLPFLGFSAPPTHFGLRPALHGHTESLAQHEGKAHVLSIGQTGSGKTNLMIANLLMWEGSAVVVDVRGDAMRATARWRREVLGQKVYVIDPFAKGGSPDRLDPLQIMKLPNTEPDSEAQSIASIFTTPFRGERDAYWHIAGGSLLGGLAAHLMAKHPPDALTMNDMVKLLFTDDFDYSVAVMLDTAAVPKDGFAHESIAAYLELPDGSGATRACVKSMARSMVDPFRGRAVQSAMGPSTVDLNLLMNGEAVTIFLVLPIERIVSHSMVMGMWIDLLCQTILRRTVMPKLPTMLFVDECAQLGCVSAALRMIAVYMRGNGVKLWSMFQDYGQIKTMFANDVSTFVNSASAITMLPGTGMAARELAAALCVPQSQLEGLTENQQLVYEVGKGTQVVRMAKYWQDELFKGRFDVLDRFKEQSGDRRTPNRPETSGPSIG